MPLFNDWWIDLRSDETFVQYFLSQTNWRRPPCHLSYRASVPIKKHFFVCEDFAWPFRAYLIKKILRKWRLLLGNFLGLHRTNIFGKINCYQENKVKRFRTITGSIFSIFALSNLKCIIVSNEKDETLYIYTWYGRHVTLTRLGWKPVCNRTYCGKFVTRTFTFSPQLQVLNIAEYNATQNTL